MIDSRIKVLIPPTFDPITPVAPKPPDYFGDFSLTKEIFRIYLKEECESEHNKQLSFKYFVKSFSIPKLLSKVDPDVFG